MLYKNGGVYVDIDGAILKDLSTIILPTDSAVLSHEKFEGLYVQWALIFEKAHPFMKRTLEKVIENIKLNKFPNDVHKMTGPTVYTEAVRECLAEDPAIPYRVYGVEYKRDIIPKHFLNRIMYFKRENWKKTQMKKTVLK